MKKSRVTAEEFESLIRATIPQSRDMPFRVEHVEDGKARVRMIYSDDLVRAGGSISGPALFTLADLGLYLAVLTRIGMEPLAVTADMNIHFLRKPRNADVIADCELLKLGRKLAVGTVTMRMDGDAEPVAYATGSYALPDRT